MKTTAKRIAFRRNDRPGNRPSFTANFRDYGAELNPEDCPKFAEGKQWKGDFWSFTIWKSGIGQALAHYRLFAADMETAKRNARRIFYEYTA